MTKQTCVFIGLAALLLTGLGVFSMLTSPVSASGLHQNPTPTPIPTATPEFYLVELNRAHGGIKPNNGSPGIVSQRWEETDVSCGVGDLPMGWLVSASVTNTTPSNSAYFGFILDTDQEGGSVGNDVWLSPYQSATVSTCFAVGTDYYGPENIPVDGEDACQPYTSYTYSQQLSIPHPTEEKLIYYGWYHINDRSYEYNVTLTGLICYGVNEPLPVEPPQYCWDYYEVGDQIGSDAVDAFNDPNVLPLLQQGEFGKSVPGIEGGAYYMIEVTPPAWLDGDLGDYPGDTSYAGDLSPYWLLGGAAEWYPLPDYPGGCWQELDEETGRGRLFFWADSYESLEYTYGIRASDPNADWDNNLGQLNYVLHEAIYTPPPSACEARFDIGDVVNTGRIPAWYHDGLPVFTNGLPQPGQTYLLEISGDPWYNEGLPTNAVDMSFDNGTTWVNLRNITGECESELGGNVYRFYFKHVQGRTYKLRAAEGSDNPLDWLENTGYVRFSLNYVFDYTTNDCSGMFSLGSVLNQGGVPSNVSSGARINYNLTPDTWYALEITSPPWNDNGTPLGTAELSGGDSGWTSWYNLPDYPGVACSEMLEATYQRIYFKSQYSQYLLRADDVIEQFGDNTGDVNYKLYSVTATGPEEPPGSCELNYHPNRIIFEIPILYANLNNGLELKLTPGKYMIETMEGPWMNESTPSYEVEITSGGLLGDYVPVTVQGYAPPLECVVLLSDQLHYRAYFSATAGDSIRVRVYDPEGTFATNTGRIVIGVYKITTTAEEPPALGDYTVNGCNSICVRPDSAIDLPAWLEYGRCSFSKYIAFCPYHAAAITSVMAEFNNREPFGTLLQFTSLPGKIKAEYDQYQWAPSAGGAEIMAGTNDLQPWELFATLPNSSPYVSGRIEILKPMAPFSTFCQTEMGLAIGTRLAGPTCFALNALNGLGLNKWFQLLFDLGLLSILGLYIYNAWIKQMGN